MAERRSIPRVSIGTRLDWRVGQVLRLHLQDWHQSWCTLPTATTMWKHRLHERRRFQYTSRTTVSKTWLFNHQQILLSAFNELKAKEYLRFRCICEQDIITHWITQPNNTWSGWVSTGRRISRRLHPQHEQKAQRGGILHLGTINGKTGTPRCGKTKNGEISDNNNKAGATPT